MHPYSSIDTTAALKKLCFILSLWSDFHMTNCLLVAVHAFASRVLMSFSVNETLLRRQVNLSTSFRELPFSVKMSPLWLKHMNSALPALTWRPMPPATRFRICNRVSAKAVVFAYAISEISVRNCLCGTSSASFLCQLETVIFQYINRRSKHIV